MLSPLCARCGGEIVSRLRPETPAVLDRCAACGHADRRPLEVSPDSARRLAEAAEARRSLRSRLRPARPFVLLWLPRERGHDPEYLDTAAMIRERLVDDDPSVTLVESPYPTEAGDPRAALAGLADLTLLVAPGKAEADAAGSLLDRELPSSRALVLAVGANETERHGRVRPVAASDLFDTLAAALLHIRRLAFWCALDPEAVPGDLLLPEPEEAALVAAAADEVSGSVLALLERGEAGASAEPLAARLPRLESAGLVKRRRDGIRVRTAGRRLLRLLTQSEAPPAEADSALARLFREAQAGDQEALGHLLKTGGEEALRIANRRLGPVLRRKVDSIDISQSVIGDLLDHIQSIEFRGEAAWRGYLRQLVENKIRAKADYYGAKKRDVRREISLDRTGVGPTPSADRESPAEALLRREELTRLESALDELPEAEREVIVYRIFDGLSHREIANRMNRPSDAAVQKLYARALARLAGIVSRSA